MKQDGWTKTPNKIYDAMAGMCEAELRVTMVLVRMTYGYQRESAELQYEDFTIHGGLSSKSSIAKGIKLALRRGFFMKGNGRSGYAINTAKSTLNEPSGTGKSTLNEPLEAPNGAKSTLNEPDKSTLNEPFQSNKENKELEERESAPHPDAPHPETAVEKQQATHPATWCWLDTGFIWPGYDNIQAIIDRLGEQPDPAALKRARELWSLSGYRTDNLLGILEWYQEINTDPGWEPKRRFNGHSRASPAPAELSEAMTIPHTGKGW